MMLTPEQLEKEFTRQVYLCSGLGPIKMTAIVDRMLCKKSASQIRQEIGTWDHILGGLDQNHQKEIRSDIEHIIKQLNLSLQEHGKGNFQV